MNVKSLPVICCMLISASCGARSQPPAPEAQVSARPVDHPDARFMTAMIHHHAQAVLIAGWAVSHDASDAVKRLSERIIVSQRDEIALMARWLTDNRLPVPDPSHAHQPDRAMYMPGMLSGEQLAQLDRVRGSEFDKLFLALMIQHHQGAITMIEQLFSSYGGAQDAFIFKIASDISADQSAEIDRMTMMLDAMSQSPGQ